VKRILCATDFSDASEAAIAEAQKLAAALGAEMVLLHVASEAPQWSETVYTPAVRHVFESQRAWAAAGLNAWVVVLAGSGVPARTLVRTGVAWEEILRVAREEQAELIVIGTHGSTGLNRLLLGSVAERVVRQARCPVLTVRPPGPVQKGATRCA
jgi:nucleotide-binding universal stress UspA family protein